MAKETFVAACLEPSHASPSFVDGPFSNRTQGFKALLDHLQRVSEESVLLGVESTGGYERSLIEWFRCNSSVYLVVLNPLQVQRFAESRLLRTKTDEVDAALIASYLAANRPEPSEFGSEARQTLKRLTRHRDHLKQRRGQEKTYLESIKGSPVESSVRETIEFLDDQIETIEQTIQDHLDEHPGLQTKHQLLSSIPGIGNQTAATLLSEMKPGLSPKQQVAHAGLAPRAYQSGSIQGPFRLSRTGNKRLRTALYFPTLAARNWNPIIESFYEKLITKSKPKMVAICACMRKLLHLAVGVLKNKTPFDPEFREKRLAS